MSRLVTGGFFLLCSFPYLFVLKPEDFALDFRFLNLILVFILEGKGAVKARKGKSFSPFNA